MKTDFLLTGVYLGSAPLLGELASGIVFLLCSKLGFLKVWWSRSFLEMGIQTPSGIPELQGWRAMTWFLAHPLGIFEAGDPRARFPLAMILYCPSLFLS